MTVRPTVYDAANPIPAEMFDAAFQSLHEIAAEWAAAGESIHKHKWSQLMESRAVTGLSLLIVQGVADGNLLPAIGGILMTGYRLRELLDEKDSFDALLASAPEEVRHDR